MRAIFKPDEPTKLIVRDADVNEVSLIQYFMNTVKSGGTLTADTRFDLNDKPAGILFTATAKSEGGEGTLGPTIPDKPCRPGGDPEFSIYVVVNTDEIIQGDTYKVRYTLDEEYEVRSMDVGVYEDLKLALMPNFDKITFSFEGNTFEIECIINPDYKNVGITYQIPEGLLGLRDIETSKENYYTGTFTFVYPGDTTDEGNSL